MIFEWFRVLVPLLIGVGSWAGVEKCKGGEGKSLFGPFGVCTKE